MSTEMAGQLPNFLYIGPDKAGSSWLHEVLIQHPEVFLSEAKDLYFFDRYYDRGLAWYASQFRRATPEHLVVGEICQDYLFHPEAARRIRTCLGDDVRMMVTIREPAARAYSSYLYMLKHGIDAGSFGEALQTRPELLEHGRYATHLRRFLEEFPAEQIHVAVFDDLQADQQTFIDAVTGWLKISQLHLDDEMQAARLPVSSARSTVAARLARRAADWTREHDGAEFVGRIKRSPLVQKALYRPAPGLSGTLTAADARYVRDALRSEIADVESMFGIELQRRWGW